MTGHRQLHRGSRGFTLVEIMVGLVIGLIAVLVTYQVFNVSEQFKRNTTALADAQQNGILSSFLMSLELSNANNGIASAGVSLDACPDTGDMATTLRPIPVQITDGGGDMNPDQLVVNYGNTSRLVIPAEFNSKVITGVDPAAAYQVQSPTGFLVGDHVVLISPGTGTGTGQCGRATVTAITPTDTASIIAQNGYVTLTHDLFASDVPPSCPTNPATPANNYCGDSTLLNLGPNPQRVRYDIDTTTSTLRSTDLLSANPTPQPISSNIVLMKAQYGIDTNNDGMIDKWVKAVSGPDGDFSAAGVMTMSYVDLSRIKAIRMAVIVRSEQFDKSLGDWSPNPPVFGDCDGYVCPTAPVITYAALTSPPGNYRYRTYETIIPLRNAIWNYQKN